MTDKAGPNWTKIGVMVAIGMAVATMLCTTLNNAPTWVPFLEQRGYDAAWLLPSVRLVQRWWRVVFAGAGLVLVGALLWWFRRQVIRPFKWLGGLGKRAGGKLRDGYLGVLWRLVVRPARDHLGVVVSVEADEEADEEAEEADAKLWDAVGKLSDDAVQVLEVILATYHPVPERTVTLRPLFLPLEPRNIRGAGTDAVERLILSLDKLKIGEFIAGWDSYTGTVGPKMVVTLAPGVLDRLVLKMLDHVEDELLVRHIPLRRSREWVPPPPDPSAWAEEVRDLPPLAATLLHAILYDYSRDPSSHVLMLRSDLKTLAEQLNVDLPEMERACADLKVARFLENFDWRYDDVGIKLDAQLAERVKGEQTVRDLMSAILSRLEAEGEWPWA